jgi:outer membrane protein TolC
VFGGRDDDVRAAGAIAASVAAQWEGVRMAVAADVALNYLEARALQRRQVVLEGGIATVEQLSRYVQGRFDAGLALSYDVVLVRERLDSLHAKRPRLQDLLETRQRRLAVLRGLVPEAATPLSDPGPFTVPPPPAGQVPADVLERRPDVQARAAVVRAQAALLDNAKADLLPRFRITFLGQDGHLQFQGVPGLGATGGLLGLSVQLPIFTAGRIEANIAANDARLEAAAIAYDKAVIGALEEVENAYGARHGADRQSLDETAALAGALRNRAISVALYENGRKTLEDVLTTRLDAFDHQDVLIQAQTAQAVATVQLYQALGGGWPTGP